MNTKKRPVVAVIGLAIFIALLYLLFSGDKTSDTPTEPQEKKATTRSGIPNLGGRSEAELLTDCQIDIQNKLSNPRSMDIIYSDLKYKKEPNHELWFQFYAKNQFNAESKHTAMCEFDDSGKLLSSKFE